MAPALVIKLGRAEGVAVLLVRTLHLQTAGDGMRESSSLGRQCNPIVFGALQPIIILLPIITWWMIKLELLVWP